MFLTLSHQNPSRLLGQIHSGMASACSVTSGRDLGQEQGREEGPEANREIPEVKPCCEACVTPFPSPHRALMCHLRGCLSQGSFPSLSPKSGGPQRYPRLTVLGLPPPRTPLASKAMSSVTLNPGNCTLQPVGGVLHPVSPGRGMVATRVSRKMAFFLPEPSKVEDFVSHLNGSGVNLFAAVWPVITRAT